MLLFTQYFFTFFVGFLDFGSHLSPVQWYIIGSEISKSLLSGHLSILLRLIQVISRQKSSMLMKIHVSETSLFGASQHHGRVVVLLLENAAETHYTDFL